MKRVGDMVSAVSAKKTMSSAHKTAKRAFGNVAHRATAVIDRRFSFIMWLMVLWMVVMLFFPLFLSQILSVAYNNRDGVYADFSHITSYQKAADALFIITCLISVVMLVGVMLVTIFYVRATWGDTGRLTRGITESHRFRYTWLIVGMVAMLFMSSASLISITCSDSDIMRTQALNLKFVSVANARTVDLQKYATLVQQYGYGGAAIDPTNGVCNGAFLNDGFLGTDASGGLMVITNTTLWAKQAAGQLIVHTASGDNPMTANQLDLIFYMPYAANVTVADPKIIVTMADQNSLLMEMIHVPSYVITLKNQGLFVAELLDTSSPVYRVLSAEAAGVVKSAAMLAAKGTNFSLYRAGVALAILQMIQTHLNKKALVSIALDTEVDVNVMLTAVQYCQAGVPFAAVVFSLCILGLVCGLIVYIAVKKCSTLCGGGGSGHGHGHWHPSASGKALRRSRSGGHSVGAGPGGYSRVHNEEEDALYATPDEDDGEWTSTTPLNSV